MKQRTELRKQSPAKKRGFVLKNKALHSQLTELQTPSIWRTLLSFLLDWSLIFIAGGVSWSTFSTYGFTYLSVVLYLFAIIVIASRQKGLENLIHESTHGNLSTNRKLNDVLALICGGIWMAPGWQAKGKRAAHIGGHHGNYADPELDQELWQYKGLVGLNELPAETLSRSLLIFLNALARTTYWRLCNIAHVLLTRPLGLLSVTVLFAVFWLMDFLIPFVIYWLIPYLTIYMPMRFLAEVSEHMGLSHDTEFEGTRNKLGWLQEYVIHPHGDGYHLVHHLYPAIPHQNLAKAHRLLLKDQTYREGHHCHSLFFEFGGRRATFRELFIPSSN